MITSLRQVVKTMKKEESTGKNIGHLCVCLTKDLLQNT